MAEIVFTIIPGKNTKIEVNGVTDRSCHEMTAAFERALGTKVNVQEKPEELVDVDQIKNWQYQG